MNNKKEIILIKAKEYLCLAINRIIANKIEISQRIEGFGKNKRFVADRDRLIEAKIFEYNKRRVQELEKLSISPYFYRCNVKFIDSGKLEDIYIGKFNFSEEKIYSWFSPISRLRFEEIGDFSLSISDKIIRQGFVMEKDQFLITGGKIVYMTAERAGQPKQLIYQEHLTNRKTGFVLPEIVEKMEKKQDEVIRADYKGSYLITGPAGSGKTTLALHRVAYLVQSPDTAEFFPSNKIILFVQDKNTLNYFKSIFPELGVDDILITTYYDWAINILGLNDFSYVYRYGEDEDEKDEYEFAKQKALVNYQGKENINVASLRKIYSVYFNHQQGKLFDNQINGIFLDRFDLAILMKNYIAQNNGIKIREKCLVKKRNEEYKIEYREFLLEYSLIIIDEVQNYLAEEIKIINSCAGDNDSVLYTGDIQQQTKLFTIKDWVDIGENFVQDKIVELDKVYRNTKEILRYISLRGHKVDIPGLLREGVPVKEEKFSSKAEEIKYVKGVVAKKPKDVIGILNKDGSYLEDYRQAFGQIDNVHVFSVIESQGVEFDVVIYVGQNEKRNDCLANEYYKEKRKIENDLEYVALTRAMNELFVCFINNAL